MKGEILFTGETVRVFKINGKEVIAKIADNEEPENGKFFIEYHMPIDEVGTTIIKAWYNCEEKDLFVVACSLHSAMDLFSMWEENLEKLRKNDLSDFEIEI